jgi:dolichol-phosphate mannosyltransferase
MAKQNPQIAGGARDDVEISVVSPVYAAAETVPVLCAQLHATLQQLTPNYEIILAFDCSPDDGWRRICLECEKDPRVKGIKLSRNFGQHQAITAGLAESCGHWIVVMDCDLQDQPKEIVRLYSKAKEGFDVVVGQRVDREDGLLKKLSSRMFHAVFAILSGVKSDASVANFGIYERKVIDAVLSMTEPYRSFPMLVLWLGFDRFELPVEHAVRHEGQTSYSLRKLIAFAVNVIVAFSNRPLYITTMVGGVMCMLSVATTIWLFVGAMQGRFDVSGWASVILSVWFLAGVTIFLLGIIGTYIAKMFDVVKGRPIYVVDRRCRGGTEVVKQSISG